MNRIPSDGSIDARQLASGERLRNGLGRELEPGGGESRRGQAGDHLLLVKARVLARVIRGRDRGRVCEAARQVTPK